MNERRLTKYVYEESVRKVRADLGKLTQYKTRSILLY